MCRSIVKYGALLILGLSSISSARAASTTVLNVDMPALIEKVADQRGRFAVELTQSISAAADGEWQSSGSSRTWTYSVQVPTAVSMSFHATRLVLPPSAVLTVSGARASITYRAQDVHDGVLWSRPLVGDTLSLSLSVAASEASSVQLQIATLQAGYRGLGGVPSHPYYARRAAQLEGATPSSCMENYVCDASAANQGPGDAIVAIIIGDLYQCTGTLINDTRNDLTPYVLTARHCQSGMLGGGAPQAASAITVYWDAVSPCGAALASIYDGSSPAQSGASTVVEQQDAWLVRLDAPPIASDAYWAGWDATGSVFTGGYSIHHALGFDKQYVGWYGQAILQQIPGKTLGIGYDSTFWGVVNQIGSVGSGASGGAIFDPNNRLVGSASLAALQDGENSPGLCPVTPTPVPTPDTVTAQYTALSAVFASTADSTSTTGAATIQSVLDPDATGTEVMDGVGRIPLTLTASDSQLTTLNTLTLSWNAPGAQSCVARGGVAGDGWSGPKAISGTMRLTSLSGGQVSYSLVCTGAGLAGSTSVSVYWIYQAPSGSITGPGGPVTIGSSVFLIWSANIGPCVASGGANGDGWAGPKAIEDNQSVTAIQLGSITYTLTCGTGPQAVTTQATVTIVSPSVTVMADVTQVRIGSYIELHWSSPGEDNYCSAAGGSATDNWSKNIALSSPGIDYISESTAGSYTYTVNCTGGGQTASGSVTVVFTNDPPTLVLTPLSSSQQVYPPGAQNATPDLAWSSNVVPCTLSVQKPGDLGNAGIEIDDQASSGTATDAETFAGQYTYQLQCLGTEYTTSATINWTNPNPTVILTSPTTTWAANYPYELNWTTNTVPCTQSGGASGDGWAGSATGWQSSEKITESAPGTYTFTLTCGSGTSIGEAQLTVNVPAPAVSISASPASVVAGQSTTLTWNSSVAPCTSIDPYGVGIDWGGSLVTPGGTAPILENTPGTYTYMITCGTGGHAIVGSTQVTVSAAPTATISASATSVAVGTPVTLSWNAPASAVCTATGGNGSDGWQGTESPTGSTTVTSVYAGTMTYGLTCNGAAVQTSVTYTAPNGSLSAPQTPATTLASDRNTQTAGGGVTLTWSSLHAVSCTASGGVSGDGWTGTLPLSGSMQVTESTAGTDTYVITCSGAPPAAKAQVSVTFDGPSSSGGGTHGGGGSMDGLTLALLSWLLLQKRTRERR